MAVNRAKFAPLYLDGVQFVTPVALVPMADVTNVISRDTCLEFSRQGLPVELARLEVGQRKGQAAHETETVTATCDVTISANRSTAATQVHIKAAVDAVPHPNAPGKAQVGDIFVGEMVTARALRMCSARSWVMVKPGSLQTAKSIQPYGVVEEGLTWVTGELVRRSLADHIDLGFERPVPKVTRKGESSVLPWKAVHSGEVMATVVATTRVASEDFERNFQVSVTVKIRSGIDAKHRILLNVARVAEDNGVTAATLHIHTTSDFMDTKGFTVNLGLSRLKD